MGTPALFVIVPDLLDRLRAAYHPESALGYDETFELVRNAPVLVLDDLGGQSSTPWAQEKLSQIINHRFNARLPTVITNCGPVHKLDERLQTRLADPSFSRVFELEPASGGRRGRRKLDVFDQPRFRNMTFDSFDTSGFHLAVAERRRLEDAYRFALDFAQKPEGWLMLTGPRGSGKTHLAVAITNYRRQMGDSPYFIEVAELLHFLRHGKEAEEHYYEEIEEIRKTPLLILDDFDFRRRNPWWDELFQILNHRYTARLPTVVTTPQTLANLSLDELGERIASLLGDPTVCSEMRLPGRAPEARARKPAARERAQYAAKKTYLAFPHTHRSIFHLFKADLASILISRILTYGHRVVYTHAGGPLCRPAAMPPEHRSQRRLERWHWKTGP